MSNYFLRGQIQTEIFALYYGIAGFFSNLEYAFITLTDFATVNNCSQAA